MGIPTNPPKIDSHHMPHYRDTYILHICAILGVRCLGNLNR